MSLDCWATASDIATLESEPHFDANTKELRRHQGLAEGTALWSAPAGA